jgi:hypothetical protein
VSADVNGYPSRASIRDYWMPWLSKWKGIAGRTACCFACGVMPCGKLTAERYECRLAQLASHGAVGELTRSWLDAILRHKQGSIRTSLQRAHLFPHVQNGPNTVQNLWLLCRNCHRESEMLPVRVKFRWLLRMSRDIRIYHDRIRQGGLPAYWAYLEEGSRPQQDGLSSDDAREIMRTTLELTFSDPGVPSFNNLSADVDLAVEEGMALYQSGHPPDQAVDMPPTRDARIFTKAPAPKQEAAREPTFEDLNASASEKPRPAPEKRPGPGSE